MSVAIEVRCATLLKELRRKKGWTLAECEEESGGEIKGVVLGSYERGHRAISLARLEQLARFYGVPIEYFFAEKKSSDLPGSGLLIFDLRRIHILKGLTKNLEAVKLYLAEIARKRQDWNGEVITWRATDIDVLSLFLQSPASELKSELQLAGFLFASEVTSR